MDPERFDALARVLGASSSRRSAARLLGGALAFAGVAAPSAAGAAARHRRRAHATDAPHDAASQARPRRRHRPPACDPGLTRCKTKRHKHACVDLATDAKHCGSCGQRCAADQVCHGGQCGSGNPCDACHTDERCCNSACVSGDCCGDSECGVHAHCSSTNRCLCDAGFHRCGSDCVGDADVAHCGTACDPCPSAPCSTATCDGTTCGLDPIAGCCLANGECDDGNACTFDVCDVANTCVHTPLLDTTPCGTDRVCCNGQCCQAPANAVATCVNGVCGFACKAGFADCDGIAANGCETNVASNVQHCGACPTACPAPVNGTATCTSGTCGFSCNAGFAKCGTGCVDTSRDTSNCGACGVNCFALGGCRCQSGTCCQCQAGDHAFCSATLPCCGNFTCRTSEPNTGTCCAPSGTVTCYTDDPSFCCGACVPNDQNCSGHCPGRCG